MVALHEVLPSKFCNLAGLETTAAFSSLYLLHFFQQRAVGGLSVAKL